MHFPHQLGPNHGKIPGAKSPYFLLGHPKEKGLGFHGEGNFVLTTESITKQSFSPNVFKLFILFTPWLKMNENIGLWHLTFPFYYCHSKGSILFVHPATVIQKYAMDF